jgi:hypothetical protein
LTLSAPEAVAAEEEAAAAEAAVDFPEKVQQVEADFRRREDRRKVVRKTEMLNPSVAVDSKIRVARSTAKVLGTSKRKAVTRRTDRVL